MLLVVRAMANDTTTIAHIHRDVDSKQTLELSTLVCVTHPSSFVLYRHN